MNTKKAPIPEEDRPSVEQPEVAEPPAPPRRRLGRFIVGHVTLHHDWRSLLPLMAQVVILRAESLYHLEAIEYLALSDAFAEVGPNDAPPLYEVTYRQLNGADTFHFIRRPTDA